MINVYFLLPLIGSPNCPTVNTMSLAVSIHKSLSMEVAARVV